MCRNKQFQLCSYIPRLCNSTVVLLQTAKTFTLSRQKYIIYDYEIPEPTAKCYFGAKHILIVPSTSLHNLLFDVEGKL